MQSPAQLPQHRLGTSEDRTGPGLSPDLLTRRLRGETHSLGFSEPSRWCRHMLKSEHHSQADLRNDVLSFSQRIQPREEWRSGSVSQSAYAKFRKDRIFFKICLVVPGILYNVSWPKGKRQNLVGFFSVGRAQASWATKNTAEPWSLPSTLRRAELSRSEHQQCVRTTRPSPVAWRQFVLISESISLWEVVSGLPESSWIHLDPSVQRLHVRDHTVSTQYLGI